MKTQTDQLITEFFDELNVEESSSFTPTGDTKPTEEKILIMEDETLKKLYSLYTFYTREAELAKVSLQYAPNDQSTRVNAERLVGKSEVLRELFWYLLKERYPELWNEDGIGIRTGWIIVRRNEPNIGKILGDLFGGK